MMAEAAVQRPWYPQLTVILRIVALSSESVLEVRSQATNEHRGTFFLPGRNEMETTHVVYPSWENACALFRSYVRSIDRHGSPDMCPRRIGASSRMHAFGSTRTGPRQRNAVVLSSKRPSLDKASGRWLPSPCKSSLPE
jgi:hypothetical protein